MLKVAARDGSTLTQMIRAAWDGIPIETRSRSRTVVASDYLVGAVCQVTSEELRARLTDTETWLTRVDLNQLDALLTPIPTAGNGAPVA